MHATARQWVVTRTLLRRENISPPFFVIPDPFYFPMDEAQLFAVQRDVEAFIETVAARYGFRADDFTPVWDGNRLDPSRNVHELQLVIPDGRRTSVSLNHETIIHQDRWKYWRKLDKAFAALARRTQSRGVVEVSGRSERKKRPLR